MNKLVIIGNGFDLAHSLPTSYKDFIDDFWKNFLERIENHPYNSLVNVNKLYIERIFKGMPINSFPDFENRLRRTHEFTLSDSGQPLTASYLGFGEVFRFNNDFFRIISEVSVKNWVDIEIIYYDILKDKVNSTQNRYFYRGTIEKLNIEFQQIKSMLENYLLREVLDKYDFSKLSDGYNSIMDIFRISTDNINSIDLREKEEFLEREDQNELSIYYKKLRNLHKKKKEDIPRHHEMPAILFLNFNYTPTAEFYKSEIKEKYGSVYRDVELINIHGRINSPNNKINFGFGDEMDEDFRIIEKRGNEFLQNIKVFQYLHNSNYRKFLSWIESGKFQVLIFGHSCGLSDRTLLNTIFEHEFCRSIKIFFYQKNTENNYTELTQNISRHFINKKALIRSKVVALDNSSPLPQIARFPLKK